MPPGRGPDRRAMSRDINRDAKLRRLVMTEGLGGASALVLLPGGAKECVEDRSFNPRVVRQTVAQLIPQVLLAAACSSSVSSAGVRQASAAVASRRATRLACMVDQGVDASVPCLDELDA